MKMLSKIGALATIGALLAGATPALADDWHGGDGDRGGWGRDGGRDWHHGGGGYYQDDRRSIEQCTRAAQREASRYGSARIEVTQVRRERYGFEVKGRVLVLNRSGYRAYDDRGYDRGYSRYHDDDRGYGRQFDEGKFKCETDMGRISDLRVWGLRNDNRW